MADSGRIQGWKRQLEKNISTPLAWDRQREPTEESAPFVISLKAADGIIPKADAKSSTDYRLQVSLFDITYKQFFGRTWVSAPTQAKGTAEKLRINFNQNVYFHTALNDTSIAAVVELVAITHVGDGKMQKVPCGWGMFRPFKVDGDMTDISAAVAPQQKLNMYHGSPRALLYIDEPIESNTMLTIITGSQIMYSVQTHRHLARVMHLIPENVLVGSNDVIPGLADPPREKGQAPDSLRKPKQVKAMPSFIEKLNISLTPSLEKVEEELCKQLIDDRNKREGKEADGKNLVIMERRLQIGVHNGWLYVDKPEVIHLGGGEAAGVKGSSLRRSMRGHQRTPSSSSLSNLGSLTYRNRIQLDGMVEDPSLMVVFVLQYVLGEPVDKSDKTKRSTKANSSRYDVVVRWAAWNPFSDLSKTSHSVSLQGGPATIPDSVFVFDVGDFSPSTTSLKSTGAGTISFDFVNQRKQKQQSHLSAADVPALSLPPTARASSQTSLNENAALQESQVQGRPPIPSSGESPVGKPPKPPSRAGHVADSDSAHAGYLTESSSHFTRSRTSALSHSQKGATPGLMSSGPMPLTPQPGSGQGMYPSPSQVYSHMPQSPYGAPPPPAAGYGYAGSPYQGVGPYSAAPVYHPTPRGYIPVEITHVRDQMSPVSTARSGPGVGGDLYELPFTPVHAPIMATVPGRHSGQGLSRAAYAKLYTAGFPPILNRNGEAPDVVDPADDIRFIIHKEEIDKLQANEITMQFLAYSRAASFEMAGVSQQPATIFFTFQFYRFPSVTTERLMLGTVQGDLSSDPHALPCLLQKLAKDGSLQDGPPGLQLKYDVDPAFMKPGEGRLFVQHLSQQQLHVDVWDGDSLMLIGSCSVDLKHLCRQGRESVQVTYELDVMATEYLEAEVPVQAGDVTREGVVRPVDVRNILKGRLHIRLANVGHPSDGTSCRTERGLISTKPKVVISSDAGNEASYGGGSLMTPPTGDHASVLRKTKVAKAAHMAEVDHELASLLYTRKEKLVGEREVRETNKAQQRKLSRMVAVRQAENESTQVISPHRLEKEERMRDLKTISTYRSHHKREGILNMLNSAITSDHAISPSLGTTQFFEFLLRNPYNTEHTVIIDNDDPELLVVTDPREWRHYKMLHDIHTPVEEGMFNTDTQSSKPEVFLRPKECVSIPFKFLTFKADHSTQSQGPSNPFLSTPKTKTGSYYTKRNDPMEERVIKVFFKTQENKPIAILSLRVEPQPHIIDQTFRFHHPEQTFLKKSIRLPPLHTLHGTPVGGPTVSQIFVRCSDPNVISESRQVQQGEPHDIFLKVACGASPQIKRFFLALYTDPYLSQPLQIWQVYVHALQRVDVSAIEGQTSRFTLVLRGTQASRLVQCFSSHQDEMQIEPREPFMLTANTLQEIHAGVRPQLAGTKFLYINVVDVEYHQLIRTWLVCVNCRTPVISKAYELVLPVGGGKGSNKRIAYTNPYPMKKVFFLRSNRDDLVQFKETRLEVGSGATESIGLRFAPSQSPGTAEILVFINDEEDKNEETFCVRATYQF